MMNFERYFIIKTTICKSSTFLTNFNKKFENINLQNCNMSKTTKAFKLLKNLVHVVFDIVVSNIVSIFFENIENDC